jgi:Mn-dependent DtxR family transcriptional regulator
MRIRSKHACRAGCCARDLRGDEALPLTQETLAQLMGVQRNAISLVAHALQRAGIIRYSRGYIDITNSGSLKETACECYRAVNAHHRRLLKVPL